MTPYFGNSGFDARSCGAPDSLKLKWELVVGLQQTRPGALDIPCGSRWSIVCLYPYSWASNTVARTVDGLRISCVLPRDLGRSGHILMLLQQTKLRINRVGGGLGTAGTCGLEMLTPRVACVFLNGLPACVGRGRILATVWSTAWIQLQKGLHSTAACGSRALLTPRRALAALHVSGAC